AEPEPDRAAVEVPAQGGVAEVAPEVRGDAAGSGRRAGPPAALPGAVADADDGALPSDAGRLHHRRRRRQPGAAVELIGSPRRAFSLRAASPAGQAQPPYINDYATPLCRLERLEAPPYKTCVPQKTPTDWRRSCYIVARRWRS